MSAERLTILAVDDEQTQLQDLARLLRSFASVQEVECAFAGHDALMKASNQAFDAIFLDVMDEDSVRLENSNAFLRELPPEQRHGYRIVDFLAIRPSQVDVQYNGHKITLEKVKQSAEQ